MHRGLETLEAWHIPVGLVPQDGMKTLKLCTAHTEGGLPALSAYEIRSGTEEGGLAISNGALFLTAKSNGDLDMEAGELRGRENFLPISAHDLRILREILARRWSVAGGTPVQAGLGEFKLKLGSHAASLAANLPLPASLAFAALPLITEKGPVQAACVPDATVVKRIWIKPMGNIGNRALQYLTAAGIAARAPGSQICNVILDMWNREEPAPRPQPWEGASIGNHYRIDVEGLADCLNRGEVGAVCIESYCFHVAHYPPRDVCRTLLPAVAGTDGVKGFGPGELVCSVRGAEILTGLHKGYFPLPPGYYAKLREESGLDLVFFGQLGDDAYSVALRAAFPDARFVPSVNQNHDFEVLRRSRNVALSISTFSWLAAWLGQAERIYMPVGGIFNPAHYPGLCFLPFDEPAYRYVLLPPVGAVSVHEDAARFWLMQEMISRQARFVGVEELGGLLTRRDAKVTCVKGFDGMAYLRANPDVANEVRALRTTALGHYLASGAAEGRPSRQFDPLFYADMYPDAAEAVALGHYPSLFAHFVEVGEALGHAPAP